ncbi:hypothetical protein CDL12_13434 [Handroanthus impetiginosus]|uniref:F-box domain-containing protein n=1 Tax=Handroanthus impetiginosus TaxID=429701 RepID=A0A2G9H9G4_9LAMI|nr:hypothetical protein CDL12_13434 [Handroanthus impetiginosus]
MDSKNQKQIQKANVKDDPINPFDPLPHEIAIDILSRLPITSLIQFSFVCRSLNSLSHDPHLVHLHLSRSHMNESSCLIFHSDYPIQNQLHFLQLSDKKVRKINTPFAISMPEFSIIGSSNGLLCLINTLFSDSLYLYNPFTRDYFEVPKNFEFQDQIVVYGFGFHPVTSDYKVVKIGCYMRRFQIQSNRQTSEVQTYSLRSNTWKNRGIIPYKLEKSSSPGVLVSGRLHWVSRWGKYNGHHERIIVSYDLADDSFHEIRIPGSISGSFGRWVSCHLASLDGCLCAIVPVPPGHGAFNIWSMKEYGVKESWAKVYNIGVYHPVSMISDELERSCHIWRNMFGKKLVKVLCAMKGGELLLEYRGGGLVSYDPYDKTFKELRFDGMPRLYQTIVHVGSLNSAAFPL